MKHRFCISFSLFLLGAALLNAGAQQTCGHEIHIGMSFPPVNAESIVLSKNKLNELGINQIRISESWKTRQDSQGVFHWDILENRLSYLKNNNFEVFLTVEADAPYYECITPLSNSRSCAFLNAENFRAYCTELLLQHSDRINRIQFGNEWQSGYWYAGTAKTFIEANNILYECVKLRKPEMEFVLGGFSTSSLRFLAGCANAVSSIRNDNGVLLDQTMLSAICSSNAEVKRSKEIIDSVLTYAHYDNIDLHFYDDPDQWDEYRDYLNVYLSDTLNLATKPYIVSEFGGPDWHYQDTSEAAQALFLQDCLISLEDMGIEEAYFFKLLDETDERSHEKSGLLRSYAPYPEKEAFQVLQHFSLCTGTRLQEESKQPLIFYDPEKSELIIRFSLDQAVSSISISDLCGRTLLSVENNGSEIIRNISSLNPGLYLISLNGTDKHSEKLLVH